MNANRGALTLAVIALLVLIAARPAQAQTETVLYSFTGGTDGGVPRTASPLTVLATSMGRPSRRRGFRTLELYLSFRRTAAEAGTRPCSTASVLPNCTDGAYPNFSYVIFDSAGNLYGTTALAATKGYGVVFELSPVGGKWTETVLYSFAGGADGADPVNGHDL